MSDMRRSRFHSEAVLLRLAVCIIAGAAIAGAPSTGADTITLSTGEVLEGVIREEGDGAGKEIIFYSVDGEVQLKLLEGDVVEVEPSDTLMGKYFAKYDRLVATQGDADDHYMLGLWCAENKMKRMAKRQCEEAVRLDPGHEAARSRLGYIRYEDRWVTEKEYSELTGLVKGPGGEWVEKIQKYDAGIAARLATARVSGYAIGLANIILRFTAEADEFSLEAAVSKFDEDRITFSIPIYKYETELPGHVFTYEHLSRMRANAALASGVRAMKDAAAYALAHGSFDTAEFLARKLILAGKGEDGAADPVLEEEGKLLAAKIRDIKLEFAFEYSLDAASRGETETAADTLSKLTAAIDKSEFIEKCEAALDTINRGVRRMEDFRKITSAYRFAEGFEADSVSALDYIGKHLNPYAAGRMPPELFSVGNKTQPAERVERLFAQLKYGDIVGTDVVAGRYREIFALDRGLARLRATPDKWKQIAADLRAGLAEPWDEALKRAVFARRFDRGPASPGFEKVSFDRGGEKDEYYRYLPPGYNIYRSYPLVALMPSKALEEKTFMSYAVREANDRGWIAICPGVRGASGQETGAEIGKFYAALADATKRFSVDPERIYLLSFAFATHAGWDVLAARPGVFAGAVLLGELPPEAEAGNLCGTPVAWFLGGDSPESYKSAVEEAAVSLRMNGVRIDYAELEGEQGFCPGGVRRAFTHFAGAGRRKEAPSAFKVGFNRDAAVQAFNIIGTEFDRKGELRLFVTQKGGKVKIGATGIRELLYFVRGGEESRATEISAGYKVFQVGKSKYSHFVYPPALSPPWASYASYVELIEIPKDKR